MLSLADGLIAAANAAAIRLLARPSEALRGRTFTSFLTPSSALLWEAQFNPLLMVRGAVDGAFLRVYDASGAELPVLVAATARHDGSTLRIELALLPARQRVAFEDALRSARDEAETARAESEKAREALAESIVRQQATEAQLRQAQKMEVVGQLAGGIAHDFNNLLGIMGGHLEEALERIAQVNDPVLAGVVQELAQVRGAAERAAAVVRQLLAFSGRQVLAPGPLDLGAVTREAVPLLQPILGSEVACELTVDPATDPVIADRGQIEQILLNLVLNARDAMHATDRRGTLRVTVAPSLDPTNEVEHVAPASDPHEPATCRAWVRLTVADNGIGMDEATLARVFEPFFTTKPVGAGSGLGLSMVYGIVQQSGGRVSITSTPGVGTTVVVDLPSAIAAWPRTSTETTAFGAHAHGVPGTDTTFATQPDAFSERQGAATVSPAYANGAPVVLLVDDEAPLRHLTKRLLERFGFQVIVCENGADALALWRQERSRIAAIVSDVTMPEMDGHALRCAVRGEAPALPILLLSGYAQQPMADWGASDGFLEKPFTREELLAAMTTLNVAAH